MLCIGSSLRDGQLLLLDRLYARWQFQDYISTRAVQIVQPDLIQAGGIWESRKIAAMAESKSIGKLVHVATVLR
eukprot:COSAG02_NODE_7_length_64539_cov_120.393482_17_plen_74_part_00